MLRGILGLLEPSLQSFEAKFNQHLSIYVPLCANCVHMAFACNIVEEDIATLRSSFHSSME